MSKKDDLQEFQIKFDYILNEFIKCFITFHLFLKLNVFSCCFQQPHSIVQRRLLEGNITRLRGEARDQSARLRSPLADTKDGPAEAEERSESTADDSTEERESFEESEKSLRSDEEEEEEEDEDDSEAGAGRSAEKPESSSRLTALIIQCKVLKKTYPACVHPLKRIKRQRQDRCGRVTHLLKLPPLQNISAWQDSAALR